MARLDFQHHSSLQGHGFGARETFFTRA